MSLVRITSLVVYFSSLLFAVEPDLAAVVPNYVFATFGGIDHEGLHLIILEPGCSCIVWCSRAAYMVRQSEVRACRIPTPVLPCLKPQTSLSTLRRHTLYESCRCQRTAVAIPKQTQLVQLCILTQNLLYNNNTCTRYLLRSQGVEPASDWLAQTQHMPCGLQCNVCPRTPTMCRTTCLRS